MGTVLLVAQGLFLGVFIVRVSFGRRRPAEVAR